MNNEPVLSSEGLDPHRKRVLFRCWHRGMREMDIILGRYADAHLPSLSDDDLKVLIHLMDAPDQDLYKWISGKIKTPDNYKSHILDQIIAFHNPAK